MLATPPRKTHWRTFYVKTGAEIREYCIEHKIDFINLRPCSVCNVWFGFQVNPNLIAGDEVPFGFPEVALKPGCGCSNTGQLIRYEWDAVAEELEKTKDARGEEF